MIQLAFEPAFDPFHAAFRLLRQALFKADDYPTVSRAKLLDFFMAEPRRCLDIRVPPALKPAARRAAACQPATYGRRPSASSLFNRMVPMQDAALQTLVLQGVLDADAFTRGFFSLSAGGLSQELIGRIRDRNRDQFDLLDFLCNGLAAIPFDGKNGLKHRTGLGEYQYDIV